MARKGYGRQDSLVAVGSYPDDGTSPVGSDEWNKNPKTDGILGFTKATSSISSNNVNVTDSYIEITGGGDINTLAAVTTALSTDYYPSDTSTKSYGEGDLLYLVKAAGAGATNLKNQQGGAGAGKITTLTGGDKALSATVPTILIARTIGSVVEWVEYGGGTASDLDTTNFAAATLVIESEGIGSNDNDTTLPTSAAVKDYVDTQVATEDTIAELNDTTITGTPADNEVLAYDTTASKWINQTAAEAGVASSGAKLSDFAATSSSELAGIISDETGSGALVFATSPTFVTPALGTPASGVATNLSGTAASLTAGTVTTNANLTGEVTSSGNTATIANDIIQEGNLQVSNAPTNGYVLTARSGVTGGYTWEAAAGGFVATADDHLDMTGAYSIHDIQTLFLEHQSDSFDDSSNDRTNESQLFVKQEDTNNDGLYIRLRVNGNTQNVKIA